MNFCFHKRYTTFTPRLLSIDHKSSLGGLPADGGLYEDNTSILKTIESEELTFSERDTLWEPNRLQVLKDDPIARSEFQKDLESGVQNVDDKEYDFRNTTRTWTDFMCTRYHPRSINVLPTMNETHQKSTFDCYSRGTQMWKENYFDDDVGDRIRQYIEECNNCQGFQTLFDCSDAFSGLSIKVFEHIQDEYNKTSLTIPIFSPKQIDCGIESNEALCDSIRVVNSTLTYVNLIDTSSLILPLSTMSRCWRKLSNPRRFPSFNYDPLNLYDTSSILATYLDTISLRYRVTESIDHCHLASFCSDLTNYGRKVASAGLAMPFKMTSEQDLIDCLDQFEGKLFTPLSPHSEIGTDRIVQSVCVRGIPEHRVKNTKSHKVMERQQNMAGYRCDSVSEMFQLYFQCANYASLSHVVALEKGMPTKKPFPVELFDERLNKNGFWNEFASDANESISSVPLMAMAQSSSEIGDTLETLHREAKRIKITKIHRFKESGLEFDEYEEALEKLLEFKANYDDCFEL